MMGKEWPTLPGAAGRVPQVPIPYVFAPRCGVTDLYLRRLLQSWSLHLRGIPHRTDNCRLSGVFSNHPQHLVFLLSTGRAYDLCLAFTATASSSGTTGAFKQRRVTPLTVDRCCGSRAPHQLQRRLADRRPAAEPSTPWPGHDPSPKAILTVIAGRSLLGCSQRRREKQRFQLGSWLPTGSGDSRITKRSYCIRCQTEVWQTTKKEELSQKQTTIVTHQSAHQKVTTSIEWPSRAELWNAARG